MVNLYEILVKNNRPVLNVVKKLNINKNDISIQSSVNMLNNEFDLKTSYVEKAYLVSYDDQYNATGVFLISVGDIGQCSFFIKPIVTYMILSGVNRFNLFHNHPNGILEPSQKDIDATNYVSNVVGSIGLELVESVIITRNGWRTIKGGEVISYE